ncbi:MAG: hypothetical protein JWO71_1711 [Candidatus Acidoferrum typicum]|nr:hypothetical protein [Candidatus Acidoferrum typicum]
MQIQEMRSALASEHAQRGMGEFPSMPAWAVRRIYEKRNGLSLTPFPSGMEVRSARSILATTPRSNAPAKPTVVDDDPNGEKEKLRIRLEAFKLL